MAGPKRSMIDNVCGGLGQTIVIEDAQKDKVEEICRKWLNRRGFNIEIDVGNYLKANKTSRIFSEYIEVYCVQTNSGVRLTVLHYDSLSKPAKDSIRYLELAKYVYMQLGKEIPELTVKQLSDYPLI